MTRSRRGSGNIAGFQVLFALPTFLGACLLFVVEPMLAKWMLPTLGGSPATWAACLALFQVLLVGGYGYAHAAARLGATTQARLHAGLTLAAVAWVVVARRAEAPSLGTLPPSLAVTWLLLRKVGLPYVLLASTAPLLQAWAVRVSRAGTGRLYALSNAGSLVGLLAYPFAIEPLMDVNAQLRLWSDAFLAFAVALVATTAITHARLAAIGAAVTSGDPAFASANVTPVGAGAVTAADAVGTEAPPSARQRAFWLASAFVPSVMLLAATGHITVDVAATPLLWAVPLALYLVTFIVAFSVWNAGLRWPVLALWVASALGVGVNAFEQGAAPLVRQVGATLLALFSSCLLCHGELSRARPGPAWLTGYYLTIAVGGALGGSFVSFVAPVVLRDYYELELGALATFALLVVLSRASGGSAWTAGERRTLLLGTGVCVPLLAAGIAMRTRIEVGSGKIVERSRSFLGPLRVVDLPEGRILTHGRIQHGMQRRGDARREPTMYFGPGTALARVLGAGAGAEPRRIGVVGLGVGTIAAHARPGDALSFYELDPAVVDIARRDFTFLSDSRGHVDIAVGDGRLLLAAEPPRAFDVLVLDAFSSDAVPIHLLTREAFAVYLRQLAPHGVLLLNVSNRHLAVDRVVRASAKAHGLACEVVETQTSEAKHVSHVAWAVVARDAATLAPLLRGMTPAARTGPDVLFTDTRASILSIVR